MMKLYNTPTKQIEYINPLAAPTVTVYTCGPTVYDYAHVGHWFTYVRADTLIRTLKLSGLMPKWVMNITDVGHLTSDADEGQDKMEKGAHREGKTAWEIANFYTQDFLNDMQQLNLLRPDVMPKATDHIAEQIELVKQLEAKGYTYTIDDGVYYDTSKFPHYADFAHLDLSEQQARVAVNHQKRSQRDFALWKFSPMGEKRDMEWDSPWGKGFPGWHLECSAMSMKYLGHTLDIHTGGVDHIPIHHTNEIAQSEAATGKKFVNTWMHANHVLIDGAKISKSLNNSIRLQELVDKGISPMALRLHILESHYRTQSHFSWETLEAAANRLQAYQELADLRWQLNPDNAAAVDFDFISVKEAIQHALESDLNTPQALMALSETEQFVRNNVPGTQQTDQFNLFLDYVDQALGLNLLASKDITAEQKAVLQERQAARDQKDWAKSDELRHKLADQGIVVRDTPHGVIWSRD